MATDTLSEAIALIKAGKKAEAQKILEPFIEANPQNIAAWMWDVETWPDWKTKIKVLEMCLKHNPGDERVRQALASLSIRQGQTAQNVVASQLVSQGSTKPPADDHQSGQASKGGDGNRVRLVEIRRRISASSPSDKAESTEIHNEGDDRSVRVIEVRRAQTHSAFSHRWIVLGVVGGVLILALVTLGVLAANLYTAGSSGQATIEPIRATPTPSTGKWQSTSQSSKLDIKTIYAVYLDADTPVNGWISTKLPTLVVSCTAEKLMVAISVGMQIEPSHDNDLMADVKYRFDSEKVISEKWLLSKDGESISYYQSPLGLAYDPPEHSLGMVYHLEAHDTLVFGFTPYNHSFVETTFDLRGLQQASKSLQATCGWK